MASRTPAQRCEDGIATLTDHRRQATDLRNARTVRGEPVTGLMAVNSQIVKEAEIADLLHDDDQNEKGQALSQQIEKEINAIFQQPQIQSLLNENEVNQDIVNYIGELLKSDEDLALLLHDSFVTAGTTAERKREKVGSKLGQEVEEAKCKIDEKTRRVAALENENKELKRKCREDRDKMKAEQAAKEATEARFSDLEYEIGTHAFALGGIHEDDEDEQAAKDHVIALGIFRDEFPQTWSRLENIVEHLLGSTHTITTEAVQEAVGDMGQQVQNATAAADKSKTKLTEAKAKLQDLRVKRRDEKRRADKFQSDLEKEIADHKVTTTERDNADEKLRNARADNEKLTADIETKDNRIAEIEKSLTKAQTRLTDDAKARGGDVAEWQGKQLAEEVQKDEFQRQRDELKTENSTLKRDLKAKQEEAEQLKVQKAANSTELAAANENINRLEAEVSDKKKDLKDVQDKLESLKMVRRSDTTRHNDALQAANRERDQLRLEMQNAKDDAVRDERATAAEERRAVEEIRGQLDEMRDERNVFERQHLQGLSRVNGLKIELKHATDKVDRQENEVKRLEHVVLNRNDRIATLMGEIAGFREQVAGTDTEGRITNAQLNSVQQQLKSAQDERDKLRGTLTDRDRVLELWREIVLHQSMEDPSFLQRDIPAILEQLTICLSQTWNVTSVDIKRAAQNWLSYVNDNSAVSFVPGTVAAYGWYLFLQAATHPQNLNISHLQYFISLLANSDHQSQVLGYLQASLEQLASIADGVDHLTFDQTDFFVRGCEFLFMNLFPGQSLDKIKALWLRVTDKLHQDHVMLCISEWNRCRVENVSGMRGQFFLHCVRQMNHLALSQEILLGQEPDNDRVFIATPGETIYLRTIKDITCTLDAENLVWIISVEGFPSLSLRMNGENMKDITAALPGLRFE